MNRIPNRKAICDVLMEEAGKDRDILVLCSDSKGSASLGPFAEKYPEQFVELGIAEQNLVSVASGLAACGKKVFAASPASFLSARSYEQCKIDVAYSHTNVTLIGISGGVSYGALGMSHHSVQDIAAMAGIPGMRVYLPSDRFQSAALIRALLEDEEPAYLRIGRNAVEDVYEEGNIPFRLNRAEVLKEGKDILLVSCGEMVRPSLDAAFLLEKRGISAAVIDMYCVKPMDLETLLLAAEKAGAVLTVEEHSLYGGLGAMVSQAVSLHCPKPVRNLALPDAPVITGTSKEVFRHYGLDKEGIAEAAAELLERGGGL